MFKLWVLHNQGNFDGQMSLKLQIYVKRDISQ